MGGGLHTVILTICVLIIVTVSIAAFMLAPRLAEGRVVFDNTPDTPAAFGYRMAWLAVRTRDTARVAEVLGLPMLQQANWRTGVGTVYDPRLGENHIYIAPPVNGWTLVVGLSLPQPLGGGFVDKCLPMMLDLAENFPEAQYFLSCGAIDFYGWARVLDGKLVRAFAIGDEGVIWNKGKATKEERALGLKLLDVKGVRGRKSDIGSAMTVYPTEAHVMHLAGLWSLDPTSLATSAARAEAPMPEPGQYNGRTARKAARKAARDAAAMAAADTPALGVICATPGHWRPERLRRTA